MATKHQNMVKLVERLKTNPMSQTEIARFFCVTPRTVMRYIKEMEETTPGFNRHPINGRQYKYSVQEDDDFSPKLLRDIEKMQQQFSANGHVAGSQILSKILAKLNAKTNLDKAMPQVQVLDSGYYMNHGPFAEHKGNSLKNQKLLIAIRDCQILKISYTPRDQDELSDKQNFKFRPYKVSLRVGRLYLVGERDDDLGQFISIPIDRITRYQSTGLDFKNEVQAFDIDEFYKYSWGQYIGLNAPEKITLNLKDDWLVQRFIESNFNPKIKIEEKGRGKLKKTLAHLELRVTPDFESFVFGHMPNLEVVKPAKLREKLFNRAKGIAP